MVAKSLRYGREHNLLYHYRQEDNHMARKITAIYEKGHLRPLEPVDLKEGELVYLTIIIEGQDAETTKTTPDDDPGPSPE
jgi:predicted DNA-binding antitoxin AbrB/MazE fold protein